MQTKKWFIICFLAIAFSSPSYAASVQVFPGAKQIVSRFQDSNKLKLLAGAVASLVVHEASHVAMLEIRGIDYQIHINGIEGHGRRDYWSDMAGCIGQIGVGAILPMRSDFALGYNAVTFLSIATYPIRIQDDGDFLGHHRMMEWSVFTMAATINLMRIEW